MSRPSDMFYVVYNGIRPDRVDADNLHLVNKKDKPPVVLIHGAGGTHLYWPTLIRRLVGYPVFALDLPGHGKSTGDGKQSIEAYADTVKAWMDFIGLGPAAFFGHSMGGAIVLNLALEYPQHVLGLGLLSSGARLRVHPALLESTTSEATLSIAVEQLIQWAFDPQFPPRQRQIAAKRMAETPAHVFHGDFLACNAFDVRDRLVEISQPTIVVCGAADQLTPVRFSEYLAGEILGAQLKIIHGAGHMVMLEQPAAVAEIMRGFLEGIR